MTQFVLAMIIGFAERIQNVSESGDESDLLHQVLIQVVTLRTAEREHPIPFRLMKSRGTATVGPLDSHTDPYFDAYFGYQDHRDSITLEIVLQAGVDTIPPLVTLIRNDIFPEQEECFTIQLFPVTIHECNDSIHADKYFCEHTICIESDGKCRLFMIILYPSYDEPLRFTICCCICRNNIHC